MTSFNRNKAREALANLALSKDSRRFADHWLKTMSDDGRLDKTAFDAEVGSEIQARTVSFEITPHTVRIKNAGKSVVEAVGIDLDGADYLELAPPAQRATRLMRFSQIAEGHISTHQRWVVNTAGKMHILNELAVPCGLSDDGLPMVMSYVDADSPGSIGHIPAKMGVMNIAPVFEAYPIH